MVDGNRDGEMSFSDPDIHDADGTTAEKPYRFWLNNDMDANEQDFPRLIHESLDQLRALAAGGRAPVNVS